MILCFYEFCVSIHVATCLCISLAFLFVCFFPFVCFILVCLFASLFKKGEKQRKRQRRAWGKEDLEKELIRIYCMKNYFQLNILCSIMYVSLRGHGHDFRSHRGLKGRSDPFELDLQTMQSTWSMLGTKLWTLANTVWSLDSWAISPASLVIGFMLPFSCM